MDFGTNNIYIYIYIYVYVVLDRVEILYLGGLFNNT